MLLLLFLERAGLRGPGFISPGRGCGSSTQAPLRPSYRGWWKQAGEKDKGAPPPRPGRAARRRALLRARGFLPLRFAPTGRSRAPSWSPPPSTGVPPGHFLGVSSAFAEKLPEAFFSRREGAHLRLPLPPRAGGRGSSGTAGRATVQERLKEEEQQEEEEEEGHLWPARSFPESPGRAGPSSGHSLALFAAADRLPISTSLRDRRPPGKESSWLTKRRTKRGKWGASIRRAVTLLAGGG